MAPAGRPPHLFNPYAGDDPEERRSRSAVAAGRAIAAGAIGLGAVALFSGTAAADEETASDETSELAPEEASGAEQESEGGQEPSGADGDEGDRSVGENGPDQDSTSEESTVEVESSGGYADGRDASEIAQDRDVQDRDVQDRDVQDRDVQDRDVSAVRSSGVSRLTDQEDPTTAHRGSGRFELIAVNESDSGTALPEGPGVGDPEDVSNEDDSGSRSPLDQFEISDNVRQLDPETTDRRSEFLNRFIADRGSGPLVAENESGPDEAPSEESGPADLHNVPDPGNGSSEGGSIPFGEDSAAYETGVAGSEGSGERAPEADGGDAPELSFEELSIPGGGSSPVDAPEVDFSDVDFSDLDFSDLDFSDLDFSDLDFSDVDLSNVDVASWGESISRALQEDGDGPATVLPRVADLEIGDRLRVGDLSIGDGRTLGSFLDGSDTDRPSLDEVEITIPDDVRQSIQDRITAERIDSTGQLRDVTVNGERPTWTDGALTVGGPRISTENVDVDFDGQNITVDDIEVDAGTLRLRDAGRDPETGLVGSTDTNVVLNPQVLGFGFPNGPDRPEQNENIRVDTTNRVGFTTGNTRPTGDDAPTGEESARWSGAGILGGADFTGRVSNTDGGVATEGTLSVPVRGYAGFGEDRPDGGSNVSGNVTYMPYQVQFGPDGSNDESSRLAADFDARVWDGPRRDDDGLLVEPGVRAEGFLTGQYAGVDGRQVQIPGTTRSIETNQEQGRITLGGSLEGRESVRSDTGWDLDASGAVEAEVGGRFSGIETDYGRNSTSGVFGNAEIRGDVRAGDLEGREQVFVEGRGSAGVAYDSATGTDFTGEVRGGIGGRIGDVTAGGGYTVGTGRSGFDANVGVQDVVGGADLRADYRQDTMGGGDQVSVGVEFNGRNDPPASTATADRPLIDYSGLENRQDQLRIADSGPLRVADGPSLSGSSFGSPPSTVTAPADTPVAVADPGGATGPAAALAGTQAVSSGLISTGPVGPVDPAPLVEAAGAGYTFDDSFTVDTTPAVGDFGGGDVPDVTAPDVEIGLLASPALDTLLAGIDSGPAPVVDVPAPVVDVPAPVVDVPAPVVDVPAPVVDVPAPALDTLLAGINPEPAPVVDVPAATLDLASVQTDLFAPPPVDIGAMDFGDMDFSFAGPPLAAFDPPSFDMPDLSSGFSASDVSFSAPSFSFGGGFF